MMNFSITWLWEICQSCDNILLIFVTMAQCNRYFLINQNRSWRRCHDNKSNFGRIHPKYNSSFSTLDDQKSLTKYLFHTMLQQNSKLLIKMVIRYIILFNQIHVVVGKNHVTTWLMGSRTLKWLKKSGTKIDSSSGVRGTGRDVLRRYSSYLVLVLARPHPSSSLS